MKKHGGIIYDREKDMLDFSANIHPNGMPDEVEQAMKEALKESIHYPDPECTVLRQHIAAKYHIDMKHIICGNGAADLIFRIAFVLDAKKLLLPVPTFVEYEEAFRTASKGKIEIEYDTMDADSFRIRETILEKMDDSVDVLVLCNPNNPTGQRIDSRLLSRIVELAKQKNIFLLLDECFLDFVVKGKQYSMISKYRHNPNLFILKSFTKMYGIPGIRLGYGICSNEDLLKKMNHFTQPWNVSHIAQKAGIAACRLDGYEEKTADEIAKNRSRMIQKLRNLGFQVWDGCANYLFFRADEISNLDEVCRRQRICIRHCSNYQGLGDDYYRVAIRTREENERLIHVLKTWKEGVKR